MQPCVSMIFNLVSLQGLSILYHAWARLHISCLNISLHAYTAICLPICAIQGTEVLSTH